MKKTFFESEYYHDYLSPDLTRHILDQATPVPGITRLRQVGASGGLEDNAAFEFMIELYEQVKQPLFRVLAQRTADRAFIDTRVKACFQLNEKLRYHYTDPQYASVIGCEDAKGRVVVGPLSDNFSRPGGRPVAAIPEYLQGPHVTLFGPPDHAKMAINAMNAYHRKLPGEPAIVGELLRSSAIGVKWGADTEDSKTPLRHDLIEAGVNLTACFEQKISYTDPSSGKHYSLATDKLATPIKRFPGLGLPCSFLFLDENPIPLHIYDFALHAFHNWHNPRALVFYVPKLENQEEAQYLHTLIATAEAMLKKRHSSYKTGTMRLMIVLENPRAILRIHEIIDALHPYFVGASLGWHDYLASTARLFKEDANYRIPAKADPNIVIKYIKESHQLLADVVGSRGGIKVGGMYGILPQETDLHSPSFQVALRGFFKDVITQLKRGLTGFWVAHPDFVRLGIAIVEAWQRYRASNDQALFTLARSLLQPPYWQEIESFIHKDDVAGLDRTHPNYVRSLLVADLSSSDGIHNNAEDEVRYNIFQTLQYLADWLAGNGCVALPTTIDNIPVRVMDDLATSERSRWEVWHETYHGRIAREDVLRIAHEELAFIRKDLSNAQKVVQVKWNERTEKFYPIALHLTLQLMTNRQPVEFATELLIPFTSTTIRDSEDPWQTIRSIDPKKYRLDSDMERMHAYFEACGVVRFARDMALAPVHDLALAESIIRSFKLTEIQQAASFHGDIGDVARNLDATAAREQSGVANSSETILSELRSLAQQYLDKFGFKFLVSAQGKSGAELLEILQARFPNTIEQEISNAKDALWTITRKRLEARPVDSIVSTIEGLRRSHKIPGVQLAIARDGHIQSLSFGEAAKEMTKVEQSTFFQLASLSKTIASAFAIEFFHRRGIHLDATVNALFEQAGSTFRITSSVNREWADAVTLRDLMRHTALNIHYVKGFPLVGEMPRAGSIIQNPAQFQYEALDVLDRPGTRFRYSGGGFLVLEHLIETLSGQKIQDVSASFLDDLGLRHLSFEQSSIAGLQYARGYQTNLEEIPGARLKFPAFAAGALGTASDMLKFLVHMGQAYQNLDSTSSISHDTAVEMLFGTDLGSLEFMGCRIGLGVFVAEAGDNRFAVHQGANDGFRALYAYCFSGPDLGKGFVILSNADHQAVPFTAEVAQVLLRHLDVSGIDFTIVNRHFAPDHGNQEQIVNLGYKRLLFDAFQPTLPSAIVNKGPVDPLADINLLRGAKILHVTNQRFARAENLISDHLPTFDPELYEKQGKTMDSWETARHNPQACDSLLLELKTRASIRYISLSTAFHDGNHAEFVRILGRLDGSSPWQEILPKTQLAGHSLLRVQLDVPTLAFSQVRIDMYPDGGLSRVGLYSNLPPEEREAYKPLELARAERFADAIPKSHKPLVLSFTPTLEKISKHCEALAGQAIDYASSAFGGKVLRASNEHYGPAAQVISPYEPLHMFDGLESSRSRAPDHHEDVIIKLGKKIQITKIVLDFRHFINNNPREISILARTTDDWMPLVEKTPVKAFAGNLKEFRPALLVSTDEVWIKTFPDGGINRIHVFGNPIAP